MNINTMGNNLMNKNSDSTNINCITKDKNINDEIINDKSIKIDNNDGHNSNSFYFETLGIKSNISQRVLLSYVNKWEFNSYKSGRIKRIFAKPNINKEKMNIEHLIDFFYELKRVGNDSLLGSYEFGNKDGFDRFQLSDGVVGANGVNSDDIHYRVENINNYNGYSDRNQDSGVNSESLSTHLRATYGLCFASLDDSGNLSIKIMNPSFEYLFGLFGNKQVARVMLDLVKAHEEAHGLQLSGNYELIPKFIENVMRIKGISNNSDFIKKMKNYSGKYDFMLNKYFSYVNSDFIEREDRVIIWNKIINSIEQYRERDAELCAGAYILSKYNREEIKNAFLL